MPLDSVSRTQEFVIGDTVSRMTSPDIYGRVVQVFPTIGVVEVAWPTLAVSQVPVEELQRWVDGAPIPPQSKTALYWGGKDRHYKATDGELKDGTYRCPKCKEGILIPTSYKRQEGKSVRLLGCKQCLFLIKPCDIIGAPEYKSEKDPLSHLKVKAGVMARSPKGSLIRLIQASGEPLWVLRGLDGVQELNAEDAQQVFNQSPTRLWSDFNGGD